MKSATQILEKVLAADKVDLGLNDLRRMTLLEYHRLIEIGFYSTEDRIELLDGYVVQKMPQNDPHAVCISLIPDELLKAIPSEWTVRSQLPITLAGDSEPEPDAVICSGPKRRYGTGHPVAKDLAIVIEVAHTTLRRDRILKLRIYARNRIAVYWIINLIDVRVEVYTRPIGGKNPTYRQREDYGLTDRVPVVIAGETVGEIAVKDLLP